jgi:SAM-dependent methyltransferase
VSGRNWAQLGARLPAGLRSSAKQLDATLLWARVGSQVRRGAAPPPPGWAPPENAVLKTTAEWQAAVAELRRLGLPVHRDLPKNWDTLAALAAVLRHSDPTGRVLDAGAALYSTILAALWRYGYQQLVGINLEFATPLRRGPVRFQHGDLTATGFATASFDAITCLSVIEHGVDLGGYFQEAARLLRPGGLLVTSTDYSRRPLDTAGLRAYGAPVHVFTPQEVSAAIELARGFGLEPTGPLDLSAGHDQPVTWRRFDLRYTYLMLTLRRQPR